MNAWVILSPTPWKLRKEVRIANQILDRLKLWQHPEKTFVERITREFDFLGCHIAHNGIRVAEKMLEKFVSRVASFMSLGEGTVFARSLLYG